MATSMGFAKFKHRKATDIYNGNVPEGNTLPDLWGSYYFDMDWSEKKKNRRKRKVKKAEWNMVRKFY